MKFNAARYALTLAFVLSCSNSLLDARQAGRQPSGPQTVPVNVALKAGADTVTSSAAGTCTHAPQASIYDVVSEMWTVRQEENGRALQVTLWRPKNGSGDMFMLSVSGKKDLQVSTVKGGTPSGTGIVKLERTAKGGTFTIDAKAKTGEAITGTIQCSAFTAAIAEGG
jgi:hypothetical protein